jgi:hypothetical protein
MSFAQTRRKGRAGRSRRPAGAVLACCTLPGLAAPGIAAAQQWLVTPEIEVAAQYLDNPHLREDGEEGAIDAVSIKGGLVDAALALRRNAPTSSFLLRPAVAVYRYDDKDEDSEGYFLDLDTNGEGRRSAWRLRGNYRQEQVYRSETTSSEFDDLLPDDVQTGTGRTFVRRQRDLWRVQPGFTMNFTEVTSLALDFTYHDVTYDVEEAGEAVDYNNTRIDAAIQRALSPYNMLELGVFAFRYDPSEPSRETDVAGALVGYRHSASEVSTFFVEVGAQETRTDSLSDPDVEVSETSFLWNIGYQRQLEVTHLRFDLGQEVTPSGSGNLVERNLYRAAMTHQLQPRWLLELSAVFLNADSVADEDVVSSSDRDYLQARASLGYQLTRSWTVQGLYAFTHQDFADISGDAQEHEFRLSLIYQPPLPTQ